MSDQPDPKQKSEVERLLANPVAVGYRPTLPIYSFRQQAVLGDRKSVV